MPSPTSSPTSSPTLWPTAWGGLVYLLATAQDAGIPDDLLADPELDRFSASWALFHLARTLVGRQPADLDDPALRALAGLPPGAAAPTPEPGSGQRIRLERHAERWARVTAARLGTENEPRALVARLAARSGSVEAVPGWTEFRLRLDDVNFEVRRAGLDLDPGFVPWLGAVVVIRYA